MDIVLWKFDGSTRRAGGGWDAALAERLAAAGASVHAVDPYVVDPLAAHADAHLLSGGATPVGSTPAARLALRHARRLLDRAHATGMPVVGVGLGAQTLATALTGRVACQRRPGGAQAGVVEVADPYGRTYRVSSFLRHHIDPDVTATAGVRLAATGDHTSVQAFTYGPVTATQFHPELDAAQLAEAVLTNAGWVTDPVARARQIRASAVSAGTLGRWLLTPLGLAGRPAAP